MAVWFRANKLAVIVTKYMIFWTSGKQIRNDTPDLIYNAADPNDSLNPLLVHTLERYHNNPGSKDSRAYKLLGVYLDEHSSLNYHVNFLCNKLSHVLCTVFVKPETFLQKSRWNPCTMHSYILT
jgi:hypothetical protein